MFYTLLLRALLEMKLEGFGDTEKMDRFTFRESMTKTREVKGTLAAFGIKSNNEIFSSYDIRPLGRSFSLNVSNVSIKSILNRVIRESDTKFWLVDLDGPDRKDLLLKL